MFSATAISAFNGNLPNLVNGRCMFNLCNKLSFFATPSLTGLASLEIGDDMFRGCVLDYNSLIRLAEYL
jgi:hypothetical protein